jgi:hypothetical protein
MFIGVEQGILAIDIVTGQVINEVLNVQWIENDTKECVVFTLQDEVISLDKLDVHCGEKILKK